MKIVNVFQEGGVPKRVSYRSLPKLNRDYGTGDPERVSSVKQSIQSARDWQTNWYAKRKGTGKFEDQLDPETMSFINDKTANSAVIVSDGANYRNNNANGITRVTEDGTVITANADPTYERIAPSFGRDFDTVLTHELAHAATLKSTSVSGQTQQEFDENSKKVATPSLMKINDIVGGGIVAGGDNDYINNAAEVQARLNSMRREAKMNPEKTDYTYKDMKYWLKKYNIDYGKDKSELLMNTVAQVTPTDSRTLFAQEGTVLKQDNTRVSKPIIPEIIKAKPRQDQLIDLGGEPSTDTRTAAERNRDYWHPIKGAKERFKSSMRNGTNPLVGLERTVMPAMAGAALVTTPARIAAYKVGRRTKGNASVSLKDIKNNESTYTGSATPEGNNGDRDLLGLYLFQNDPLISRSPWFQRIAKSFKPAKGQGFNYDKRYSELYPGIEGRRYQMQSVVKSGHPLRFNNVDEFNNYSNGIGKLQGKEGDMVIEMPDGFQTFRQPGTNYVGPIDDVGGHVIKIDYNNKGKLTQISQDMWKFNPADYAKRWSGKSVAEGVRATKQAALMDKVGTPFILQQENPIYIGSRRVWDSIKSIPKNLYIRRQPLMQGVLLTMKKGGSLVSDGRRFKFKDSPLVRNSRTLNNKRDMRKKFMKSDRPTYSTNRVRKGQDGLQFVSYTPVETPDIPKFESSDVFSTYNIPIVRDESVVSQPKVDEPRIDEPIIESAVNTPMKRELFNIKPSKGLDEFNKWYDEVEKEDPEAKHYRQFLTKMAEQESGFNSAIQNRAGASAYGYFQFMQDGKKYNNITAYAGTDIETFRNNPKLQIKAAIKLAKSFERGFNKKDLELAAQKGYTKFGLLGGAWLAGNGGVRKYLQGLANPSDRHWSKSGSGTDVASRIQMFNF